jgi:hypothetical protein
MENSGEKVWAREGQFNFFDYVAMFCEHVIPKRICSLATTTESMKDIQENSNPLNNKNN